MNRYRKLETKEAVQYLGEPIPDVTCEGTAEQRQVNGCDNTRAHLPHVHTTATGGLTCLAVNDWIMPVVGGPFAAVSDALFRAHFEVPVEAPGLFLVPAPEVSMGDPEPITILNPEQTNAPTVWFHEPDPTAAPLAEDPGE